MNCAWLGLILALLSVLPEQHDSTLPQTKGVMIAAVSRDDSVLVGGVSSGKLIPDEKLDVLPLAWLGLSGQWKAISCDENHPQACCQFEQEYLKEPHTYIVVSHDGWGARVHVNQMSLDNECFGYGGTGTFSGPFIRNSAVAASSADPFIAGNPARLLTGTYAETIRHAFQKAARTKIGSTRDLHVYSVRLAGREFLAIQRALQDYASLPGFDLHKEGDLPLVFAVGTMKQGKLEILSWQNENNSDENEQIMGTIHLRNGMDFLVNTVSDPETQFFRIYGVRNGQLRLVFQGGGGGC